MNPELDALIDRYTTTVPRTERLQALAQVLNHQTANVTTMGLFHYVNPTMAASWLTNVTGRGFGFTEAWNAHEWDAR
jgi:hypothetical protein